MNCSDLESLARRGQLQQRLGDAEVLAHLRQCGACETLYAPGGVGSVLVGESESPPMLDLEAMRAELHGALQSDAREPGAWLRQLPTRWRVTAAAVLVLLTALAVWGTWRRDDWGAHEETLMWVTLSALFVATVAALVELFRPLTVLERPRVRWAIILCSVLLPFVFAIISSTEAAWPLPSDALRRASVCSAIGVGLALPSAVFVILALRTTLFEVGGADSRTLWLAAGVVGLIGNLGLQLHCPFTELEHLVMGHAPLSLLWAAALWVLSRSRRAP